MEFSPGVCFTGDLSWGMFHYGFLSWGVFHYGVLSWGVFHYGLVQFLFTNMLEKAAELLREMQAHAGKC